MTKKTANKKHFLVSLGLAALIFLLFQPQWFLSFIISDEKLLNNLVDAIEERLPEETRVFVGQVRFRALPRPSLQARNLELIDRQSGVNWIHTEVMEIYLKPFALLKGKAIPDKILLLRPRIQIQRDRDGHWRSLGKIYPTPETSGREFSQRLGLPLNTLVVKNASIEIIDWTTPHTKPYIVIDEMDAQVRRFSGRMPWRFKATGNFPHKLLPLSIFSIKGELTPTADALDLNSVGVGAELAITRMPAEVLRPYLKESAGIEPLEGTIDLEARFNRSLTGEMTLSCKAAMKKFHLRAPAYRSEPFRGNKFTFGFALEKHRDIISVKHMKFSADRLSLWGHGIWDRTETGEPWSYVALHGLDLSMDEFRGLVPDKILPEKIGSLVNEASSSGSLDISRLEITGHSRLPDEEEATKTGLDVFLKVSFDNFSLKGVSDFLPLEALKGTASFDGRTIDFENLSGRYGRSSIRSLSGPVGWVGWEDTDLTVDGRLNLDEIHRLYSGLPEMHQKKLGLSPFSRLGGYADIQAHLVSMDRQGSLPVSLSGKALLSGAGFVFKTPPMRLSNMNGKLSMEQNRLRPFSLSARIDGSPVLVQGEIHRIFSGTPRLNLKVLANPGREEFSRWLPSLQEILNITGDNPELAVTLTGPPEDLVFQAGLDLTNTSLAVSDWLNKQQGIESLVKFSGRLYRGGELIIEEGALDIQGAALFFSGITHGGEGRPVSLVFRSSHLPLQPFGLALPALRSTPSDSHLKGNLRLSYTPGQPGSLQLNGQIQTQGAAIHPRSLPQPLEQIRGRLKFSGKRITGEGLHCSWRETPLTVDLTVPAMDRPEINLSIFSPKLDFRTLMNSFTRDTKKGDQVDKEALRQLLIHSELAVDRVIYNQIEFSDFKAGLVLRDGVLSVRSYRTSGLDGTATGTARIDHVSGGKTRFSAEADITGVSAEKYLELFKQNRTFYTGEISGNIRVQGAFESDLIATARQMTGNAHLQIAATQETNYLIDFISQVIHRVEIMAGKKDERFRLLEHSGMGGDFTIDNGKFHSSNFYINQYHKFDVSGLTLDKLTAAIPIRLKYNVKVAGSYDFLDSGIDTYLVAEPFTIATELVKRVPIAGKVLTGEDQSLYSAYFQFKGLCNYRYRGTDKAVRLQRTSYKDLPEAYKEIFKEPHS
jgi:hypothetical protein